MAAVTVIFVSASDTARNTPVCVCAIINEILDYSKIETGQLYFCEEPFSPRGMLNEISTPMRPNAEEKGLLLHDFDLVLMDETGFSHYCMLFVPAFSRKGNAIKREQTAYFPIGNERLIDQSGGQVRFRYRDYAHGNTTKVLGLESEEFIRRFLLHILPKRFVRIRGYGLLANRDRRKHLQKARAALGQFEEMPSAPQLESVDAFMLRVAGIDIRLCPRCGKGRMCEVAILPPTRGPPAIRLPRTGSER